jgi:hypothetical protein
MLAAVNLRDLGAGVRLHPADGDDLGHVPNGHLVRATRVRHRVRTIRPMVAAMATFDGKPTGPADTARLVGKDLVPWLRECDGFRGVLVLTGDEKHQVITLWDTPQDEASTRPARLAMHDSVSAAAGMSLVDYEVYDLPVLDGEVFTVPDGATSPDTS